MKHYEFSDEYLAGWFARHGGRSTNCNPFKLHSEQWNAWNDGWNDCDRGAIDGPKALGKEAGPSLTLYRCLREENQRLRNAIELLRPKQENYVDFENFDTAAEQWNAALEKAGVEHP